MNGAIDGNFARLIHDAAGGAAAEGDRGRALQDIDVFVVERIAVVAAEIAHAVEENVVARGEAANGEVVALRAAFAGREADARHVAQRVAQRCRVLFLQELLRRRR